METKDFTVMLPVHRGNLTLANNCIKHILENSDYNIVVIDDFGSDSEYISDERIKFIHNQDPSRQPLAAIWNQCIEECPTDYVIIYSWRQRLSREQFESIPQRLGEGYAAVTFEGLHVFGFHKYLISKIGLFDSGFKFGQFEDTDWWYRLKYYDLGIVCDDDVAEERVINGRYVDSTWLDPSETNKKYFVTKWTEVKPENKILLHKNEENFDKRLQYTKYDNNTIFKKWNESILTPGLDSHFQVYKHMESKIDES